jgi:hypothetical protein
MPAREAGGWHESSGHIETDPKVLAPHIGMPLHIPDTDGVPAGTNPSIVPPRGRMSVLHLLRPIPDLKVLVSAGAGGIGARIARLRGGGFSRACLRRRPSGDRPAGGRESWHHCQHGRCLGACGCRPHVRRRADQARRARRAHKQRRHRGADRADRGDRAARLGTHDRREPERQYYFARRAVPLLT